MDRNPLREWPLLPGTWGKTERIEDRLARDDPRLGRPRADGEALTTPRLAWAAFDAPVLTSPAVRAAERAELVQGDGRPRLILTFDLETARRVRVQPERHAAHARTTKSRKGDEPMSKQIDLGGEIQDFDETLHTLIERTVQTLLVAEAGQRRAAWERLVAALPDERARQSAREFADAVVNERVAAVDLAGGLGFALRHVQGRGFVSYEEWLENALAVLKLDADA
jgi:hypothetical protein